MIKVKDLTLAYEGHVVVSNLNFEAEKGDYLCIVGENGSGKTTLMKSIIGQIKAAGGSITIEPKIKGFGYLAQQNIIKKDFPASVKEVVLSGFVGTGLFYSKNQKKAALETLKSLKIEQLQNCAFSELSGGQQQRVLLARSLMASNGLLLLDEPASQLDPIAANELYEIIDSLNKEGITVIMVSHDISASLKYAKHILHLSNNGYFFGTTDEYKKSEFAALLYKGGK